MKIMAKVGMKTLLNMVGIKKNSKTTYIEKDCSKCPNSKASLRKEFERNVVIGRFKNDQYDLFMSIMYKPDECMNCIGQERIIYDNEKNRYQLQSLSKLTKSQIFQMLYYHFKCKSDGLVLHEDIKETAKSINCSEETVKNNLDFLSNEGYIGFTKQNRSRIYNLSITGYSDYHSKKEQGGRGYLYFSMHQFKDLLKVNNINELRILIREFILQEKHLYSNTKSTLSDENDKKSFIESVRTKINEYNKIKSIAAVSYSYIKDSLPYYNYKSKITSLVPAMKKFFNIKIEEDKMLFSPKEKYNTKVYIENIKAKNYFKFRDYILNDLSENHELHPNVLSNIHTALVDLTSMALEYGYKVVFKALESIKDFSNIENMGAYVRTVIESY